MSKHTPGPWQRSGVRAKLGAEDCLKVGPDGFPIAYIPIGRTQNEHAGAIADAALIAAAPELLEALVELVQEFDITRGAHIQEGGGDIDETTEIRRARAAIAKATGG